MIHLIYITIIIVVASLYTRQLNITKYLEYKQERWDYWHQQNAEFITKASMGEYKTQKQIDAASKDLEKYIYNTNKELEKMYYKAYSLGILDKILGIDFKPPFN